jgi:predicted RNA-binding Zn ribbon-like protein
MITSQLRLVVMSKQQEAPGELELVRSFVNTVDLEEGVEDLSSPDALVAWLAGNQLATRELKASRADLTRATDLREALRAVLVSHNGRAPVPTSAVQILDQAADRANLRLRFREDSSAQLEPDAGGVDGALGRIVAVVHDSIAHGTWLRLKACREHTCEWAFYDHTKNRSGAWCNMGVCGNRAKARGYRERQAADSA